MAAGLDIAFFGSSLVSAYWNGAATYYRGIIRALHARGHRVTFHEPDAFGRQERRDIPDPDWARVVVYEGEGEDGVRRCLDAAAAADVIVKASGVGVFDELLEAAVPEVGGPNALRVFWDVDAPATLARMRERPPSGPGADPFRDLVPKYDAVFTYGGGPPVVEAYAGFGARRCEPIYNALDPTTHHPVPPADRFAADLTFLGNRLPDREARVQDFFLDAARALPGREFLLGGSGWGEGIELPPNVRPLGHVSTNDHNALNRTPLAVLNVSRESMAAVGYSPATRVFEAAGASACLVTDAWEGIELFLEPGEEVLVAADGAGVAEHLESLDEPRSRAIGEAALRRVLAEHTYDRRAVRVEELLTGELPREPKRGA